MVGAGPAGTAAAIELARSGHEVLLIDRARFPRDKCCGDGLTAGALRHLEDLGYKLDDHPYAKIITNVSLTSPSGRSVRASFPTGRGVYAAVFPRLHFDFSLLQLAARAGAIVRDGHALESATQDPDGVTLTVRELGEVRAKYVVGADGAFSPLARALGLRPSTRPYLGEWHAFRQYYEGVSPLASSELAIWFEPDIRPGYAWSFPISDDRVNLGFGVHRVEGTSVQYMKRVWADLKNRSRIVDFLGPGAVPAGPVRAWPIPARLDLSMLGSGRVLFVGDSASVADPLTGEGIGQALLTGRVAASAIDGAGVDNPQQALDHFRHSVAHHLEPDYRLSRLLIRVLKHRKPTRAAIRLLAGSESFANYFVRWMFEDIPRSDVLRPWTIMRRKSSCGAFAPCSGSSRRSETGP